MEITSKTFLYIGPLGQAWVSEPFRGSDIMDWQKYDAGHPFPAAAMGKIIHAKTWRDIQNLAGKKAQFSYSVDGDMLVITKTLKNGRVWTYRLKFQSPIVSYWPEPVEAWLNWFDDETGRRCRPPHSIIHPDGAKKIKALETSIALGRDMDASPAKLLELQRQRDWLTWWLYQ